MDKLNLYLDVDGVIVINESRWAFGPIVTTYTSGPWGDEGFTWIPKRHFTWRWIRRDWHQCLNPGSLEFLEWAIQHFNVKWLTKWHTIGGLQDLSKLEEMFNKVYGSDRVAPVFDQIAAVPWDHEKAPYIDYSHPFVWLEDGFTMYDIVYVDNHHARDSLVIFWGWKYNQKKIRHDWISSNFTAVFDFDQAKTFLTHKFLR